MMEFHSYLVRLGLKKLRLTFHETKLTFYKNLSQILSKIWLYHFLTDRLKHFKLTLIWVVEGYFNLLFFLNESETVRAVILTFCRIQ